MSLVMNQVQDHSWGGGKWKQGARRNKMSVKKN